MDRVAGGFLQTKTISVLGRGWLTPGALHGVSFGSENWAAPAQPNHDERTSLIRTFHTQLFFISPSIPAFAFIKFK